MLKTVLITGATSGIGWELAKLFAKNHYDLVIVGRNEEKLKACTKELETQFEINVTSIVADLAKPEASRQIFQEIRQKKLIINILINNAGFGAFGNFWGLDLQTQLDMMQVNMGTLTQLTHLFLPEMVKRGSGRILNVASVAGFFVGPQMAVYYASKAYVISFSQALSAELAGTGVTVTALCPGPTQTNFITRAGVTHNKLFRMPNMSAETVAEIGYEGLLKGEKVVIPGLMHQLEVFVSRFVPTDVLTWVVKFIHKQ